MLFSHRERVLVVHLTTGCNLRCAYCFQQDKRPRTVAWESLRLALEWLLAPGAAHVRLAFTGGEPLLAYPLLVRAVNHVERERPREVPVTIEILTNGLLLGDEAVAFIADHDIHVSLSLDGRPPAQDLRGRGTFARLDRLLRKLKVERPELFEQRLTVAMTVCRENVGFLADSVAYLLESGVARVAMTAAMTPDTGWGDADTAGLERQFAQVYERSVEHYDRTGRVPLELFRKTGPDAPRQGVSEIACSIGDGHALAVDVTGRAVPCPLFAAGYLRSGNPLLDAAAECIAHIGDIGTPLVADRLAECRRSLGELRLFGRRSGQHSSWGRCGDCPYLGRCAVCPVSIGLIPGNTDPERVPDFQCAFTRTSLAYRDRFPRQRSLDEVRRSLDRFWQSVLERSRAAVP